MRLVCFCACVCLLCTFALCLFVVGCSFVSCLVDVVECLFIVVFRLCYVDCCWWLNCFVCLLCLFCVCVLSL